VQWHIYLYNTFSKKKKKKTTLTPSVISKKKPPTVPFLQSLKWVNVLLTQHYLATVDFLPQSNVLALQSGLTVKNTRQKQTQKHVANQS
jgi:hypothetical protein